MGELPYSSQPTAPTCVVWSWHLKDLKGLLYTGFPHSFTYGYTMLMIPNKGKTALHGFHCPRDMAVHMCGVMARPWVGLSVPCFNLLVTRDPPSPRMSW